MKRRRVFAAAVAAAALGSTRPRQARTPAQNARIGVLFSGTQASWVPSMAVCRRSLRELGWVEGRNLEPPFRYADHRCERLPTLAAELVALRPDLIFVGSVPAIRAAMQATTALPIVFETLGDAVAAGVVPQLGKPASNVTGVSGFWRESSAKRLQLLHEAEPGATRRAVMANFGNWAAPAGMRSKQAASRQLGMQLDIVHVPAPARVGAAFEQLRRGRAQALRVTTDPMRSSQREQIVALAAAARLPAIDDARAFVEAGGLMSYGAGLDRFRQAAVQIDRILRGAAPGDLAIEQPTRFESIVNRKTLRALGLDLPQALLLRADEVNKSSDAYSCRPLPSPRCRRGPLRSLDELDAAFAALAGERIEALHLFGQLFMLLNAARVAAPVAQHRWPAVSGFEQLIQAGLLLSCTNRVDDDVKRVAHCVGRILKGTPPGELPVEQPTRFYLTINLHAARGLGLTLPQTLLLRADEVLQ